MAAAISPRTWPWDEQALRLLTEGAIGRDGKQLRPPMPRFRMTRQAATDVIAFLRSLP